ncbi:MAG: hypothetical protein AB1Z65_13695 [Candidatus Sulfomarinibacteraceae bacterium]
MKPVSNVVLLFGGLAILTLFGLGCGGPGPDEDPRSIRDRVVSASQGYPEDDRPEPTGFFGGTGFHSAFHSADWIVTDPFTDSVEYFPTASVLSHAYPYTKTRRVIARSKVSTQQAFLMVSEDPNLDRMVREKIADWSYSQVNGMPDTLLSRDGVELEYRVFHVPPGVFSGDEMLLELATAERGGTWLILDAGLSYGRSPDGSLVGEPSVHATLSQIVERLYLGELL